MHCIPTRLAGVELFRETLARHADSSSSLNRHTSQLHGLPQSAEQVIEADSGFTQELSYTRRLQVARTFRCLEGEVYIAAADIRLNSPTFMHWQGFYLRANDDRTLYIPAGVACGWQVIAAIASLEVRSDIDLNSHRWRWLRWNDLELAIAWPEIPEQLARTPRPARSLATLPDRALPLYMPTRRSLERTKKVQAVKPVKMPTAKKSSPKKSSPEKHSIANSVAEFPDLAPTRTSAIGTNDIPNIKVHGSTAVHRSLPQPTRGPSSQRREELILVIGSSGQLGRDLCRHLSSLGTVVGACRQPERGSLLPIPMQVDVSRPASIRQAIRAIKPTLIVNAAGLTDLEKTERQPRLAQLVNATAPSIIAEEAAQIGSSIVHFCSDLVFDGSGDRPWRESDTPRPINQYGRTKLLGTEAIRNSGVPNLILRSGWLYGSHGNNYVAQLVDLLTYRNSIELAVDYRGTPTSTDWLALTTLNLLRKATPSITDWLRNEGGLFHVAPLGYANRVEVGDQIAATCRAHALPIVSNKFRAVALDSLTQGYAIPANCQLDCSKLALHFGIQLPRWQQQLRECVGMLLTHATGAMQHVA